MADHSQTTDDRPVGVSHETVARAEAVTSALRARGIEVQGVAFNYDNDSFRVVLADGHVSPGEDGFDPQGIGGGTIKA